MFKLSFVILLLGLSVERITGDDLPSDIEKCKFEDNKCVAASLKNIVTNGSGGFKDINFDPIELEDLIRDKSKNTDQINIELKLSNAKLYGVSKIRSAKINQGFFKDFNGKRVNITLKFPTLILLATYKLDGKILALPIQGTGSSNITLVKPTLNIAFTGNSEIISGEEYLKVDDFKTSLLPKGAIVQLDNLFNGDKALGESMNKFLNENFGVLFGELSPAFLQLLDNKFQEIIQSVMYKIPYNKLFLD